MRCYNCNTEGLKKHENWPAVRVLIDSNTDLPHRCPTDTLQQESIPLHIYRKYGDIFGCLHCKKSGDKWYMIDHICKGLAQIEEQSKKEVGIVKYPNKYALDAVLT